MIPILEIIFWNFLRSVFSCFQRPLVPNEELRCTKYVWLRENWAHVPFIREGREEGGRLAHNLQTDISVQLYAKCPITGNTPTNQENWPNVFPYMALYWANVLAIVPTLGQFSGIAGTYVPPSVLIIHKYYYVNKVLFMCIYICIICIGSLSGFLYIQNYFHNNYMQLKWRIYLTHLAHLLTSNSNVAALLD